MAGHSTATVASRHPLHGIQVFSNTTERDSHTYTDYDVGKVVKVSSPLGYFLVLSQSGGVGTFSDLGGGVQYFFKAGDFSTSDNSDWAVNSAALLASDSNNSALSVMLFDDTTEEGVGMEFFVPSGASSITFHVVHRAETAPGSSEGVQAAAYGRNFPDDASVTSWSSVVDLGGSGFTIPTNENWQYDSQTVSLSTLGLSAGVVNQVEFVRQPDDGDDTLSGDWAVLSVRLEFS